MKKVLPALLFVTMMLVPALGKSTQAEKAPKPSGTICDSSGCYSYTPSSTWLVVDQPLGVGGVPGATAESLGSCSVESDAVVHCDTAYWDKNGTEIREDNIYIPVENVKTAFDKFWSVWSAISGFLLVGALVPFVIGLAVETIRRAWVSEAAIDDVAEDVENLHKSVASLKTKKK
jgi:hypothetical protein